MRCLGGEADPLNLNCLVPAHIDGVRVTILCVSEVPIACGSNRGIRVARVRSFTRRTGRKCRVFPVIRQSALPATADSKSGSSFGSGSLSSKGLPRHAESFRLDVFHQSLSQFGTESKLRSGKDLFIFDEDSGIEAQPQRA